MMLATSLFVPTLALVPHPQFDLAPHRIDSSIHDARVVRAGDIDGDGESDLVLVSAGDGRLTWLRNQGNASFAPPVDVMRLRQGLATVELTDLDGDGDLDIVSGWRGIASDVPAVPGRVFVHENLSGGEFAPGRQLLEGPLNAVGLALADFDGDGITDIAVRSRVDNGFLSQLGWLRGIGNAEFEALQVISTLGYIDRVRATDLDSDGDADLVFAHGGTISYLENLAGSFSGPIQIATALGSFRFEVGDVDADGDVDLATAEDGWFRNEGGSPLTMTSLSLGSAPAFEILLEDIDLDGDLDFVQDRASRIEWTENLGQGTLPAVPLVADSPAFIALRGAAFADLGGAQRDLLLPNAGVTRYRRQPSGSFEAAASIALPFEPLKAVVQDVDRDGDLDLVVRTEDGLHRFTNDGSGGFGPIHSFGQPLPGQASLESADMDGDGFEDLVYSYPRGTLGEHIYWRRSTGVGYGPRQDVSLLLAPGNDYVLGAARDVDLDGDLDLIGGRTTLEWFENDGTGVFVSSHVISGGALSTFHDAEDIDGDGASELLLTTPFGATLLFVSQSGGAFAPGLQLDSQALRSSRFVDADGDGDLDVVGIEQLGSSQSRLVMHRSTAGVIAVQGIPLTGPLGAMSRGTWLDWDGDGDVDLVTHTSTGSYWGERTVLENLGDATFADPVTIEAAVFGGAFQTAGDLDNDGHDDLITGDFGQSLRWFERVGQLGQTICVGVPNSTGTGGTLSLSGSATITTQTLVLSARNLPASATTFFLASLNTGLVVGPGGSQGNLCLSGSIGRFVGSGQIQSSSALGQASLAIDLSQIPTPTGFVQVTSGQSWSFQAWHRDANPGATSNFTSAVGLTFQ